MAGTTIKGVGNSGNVQIPDMVNWQDRGAVASLKDFKWFKGENGAWAEQVIERNGKWYMYCPIHGHGIGVLVADNPYGPMYSRYGRR